MHLMRVLIYVLSVTALLILFSVNVSGANDKQMKGIPIDTLSR